MDNFKIIKKLIDQNYVIYEIVWSDKPKKDENGGNNYYPIEKNYKVIKSAEYEAFVRKTLDSIVQPGMKIEEFREKIASAHFYKAPNPGSVMLELIGKVKGRGLQDPRNYEDNEFSIKFAGDEILEPKEKVGEVYNHAHAGMKRTEEFVNKLISAEAVKIIEQENDRVNAAEQATTKFLESLLQNG